MGSLPFFTKAELQDLAGQPLATAVPISIWPAPARDTDSGREYTHDGECPIGYDEVLDTANVRFQLGTKRYHVVDHEAHPYFPHC